MTPDQINVKIAELCGVRLFLIENPIHDTYCFYRPRASGYTSDIAEAWKVTEEVGRKYISGRTTDPDRVVLKPAPIPNYHGDLNACAEMEQVILSQPETIEGDAIRKRYGKELEKSARKRWGDRIWHATAPQRCEAFLRVHNIDPKK